MKPIIGITPNYSYEENTYQISGLYTDAIIKAGGRPVLLFPGSVLPGFVQGLLLSGGGDIDPLLFGEEPLNENGEISPLRDEFELSLCLRALEDNVPILGICRGMQVLCAVSGGKILQDIYSQSQSQIKHMQKAPRYYPTHTIEVEEKTKLHKLMGKRLLTVNSFHHQAVARPGEGFRSCARSGDGLIEAMEHTQKHFVLGVQWHPEAMREAEQEALFRGFIDACLTFHKQRRRKT